MNTISRFSCRCARGAGLIAAMLLAVVASPAKADLTVEEGAGDDSELTIFRMTVTPAAEPTPALKYRFLPGPLEMRDGNAALFYCRSFAEGYLRNAWKAVEEKFTRDEIHGGESVDGWYDVSRPLNTIPRDKLREASASFDTIMSQFVERGVIRRECDWGHRVEEVKGTEIIATLLPEVQESRSLGRAIALRTRSAIAESDYRRAIDHIRYNYQLGRHVAEAPFLVSGLVGIAISNLSNVEVIELIASKDSPNLYWAIAEMPRPFIDLQPSVRFETSLGLRMFPYLIDPENQNYSAEEWARLLVSGVEQMSQLEDVGPRLDALGSRLAMTGLALVTYPLAKQRLIDGGIERGAVEQMPVGKVLAVDASHQYQRFADEIEKWWYTPFAAAKNGGKQADQLLTSQNKLEGGLGHILASLLLPALNAARNAEVRLDWQLGALQTIEAIRMHAAETGQLPKSLADIEVVPVPNSPLTGQPYDYHLEGDTAVLELRANELIKNFAWRFEIKLAKE